MLFLEFFYINMIGVFFWIVMGIGVDREFELINAHKQLNTLVNKLVPSQILTYY